MFDLLTDNNFILFAAKHYDNPNCTSVSDFQNDLKHIRYIKRLVNRYYNTKTVKIRLLLNHFVVLYNLFGAEATRMLFLKLDEKFYPTLKTILLYLSYMPEKVTGIKTPNYVINSSNIPIDFTIACLLREI